MLQLTLYARHGAMEIPIRAGPTRRMHAGLAGKRMHDEARIVRESGKTRGRRRGFRFYRGILGEGRPLLLRLRQSKFGRTF
jgi:hypothetical protein